MTRQQLELEANRQIAAAKTTVELQGDFPITMLIHIGTGWRRLPFPEELGCLMNDGRAKDAIFGALRHTVQVSKADGVIVTSETWAGETTDEGRKHYGTPEWKELHDFGFTKLVQRGWITRSEAFTVVAQTVTDVLIIQQKFQRLGSGAIQLLDCKRNWQDQSHFGGRQKMFGDLRWENLGSEEATKGL